MVYGHLVGHFFFVFSSCFANVCILRMRPWRHLCGLGAGSSSQVCSGSEAIFSISRRKFSLSSRYLGIVHLPLPIFGTLRSYKWTDIIWWSVSTLGCSIFHLRVQLKMSSVM